MEGHFAIAGNHQLLGIDAGFDGIAVVGGGQIFDALAAGDAQLLADDINAGYPFGDGMLHLQASVHFHEVDGAGIEVVDELNRAGAHVVHRVGKFAGVFAHGRFQLRRQRR